MKRNGLRALALVSCVVALFSLLSVAVDLQGIVDTELVEEINVAAGMNLVNTYIAEYETVAALAAELALANTPGAVYAFDRAIFKLQGGLIPLIGLEEADLLALIAAGDQDGADAYVFNAKSGLKKPEQLEAAIAAATDDVLQIAYGKLLGGLYGPGTPVGQKTEAELLVLVTDGESLGLRVAAATALTTYWILGSELTYVDVQNEILGAMLVYPELALAYQGYLAYLYSL
jgi:hypothetical protein